MPSTCSVSVAFMAGGRPLPNAPGDDSPSEHIPLLIMYLGSLISADATYKAEIIAKAGAAFHFLKYVWDAPLGVGFNSQNWLLFIHACVRSIICLVGAHIQLPLKGASTPFTTAACRRLWGLDAYLYQRCAEHDNPTHLSVLRLSILSRSSHAWPALPQAYALLQAAAECPTASSGAPPSPHMVVPTKR